MGWLNYPIETEQAQKFWASKSKVNKCLAIIAFSYDEHNALMNLRRVGGYPYIFRKYHAWNNLGCYVNNPHMANIPFHNIDEMPWWEAMPFTENPQCWLGGGHASHVDVTGVTVDHPTFDVNEGSIYHIQETVSPANAGNKTVTWTSSDPAIATVDAHGTVTGVKAGTVTITVTTVDGGFKATSTGTVHAAATSSATPVITTQPVDVSISTGSKFTLSIAYTPATATVVWYEKQADGTWNPLHTHDGQLSWESGVINTATIRTFHAIVTNTEAGKTPTSVTSRDAIVTITAATIHPTAVHISPTTVKVTAGQNATLTATVTPSNATNKAVTWTTSDPLIATVSTAGVVHGIKNGIATITATTVDGQVKDSVSVAVVAAVIKASGVATASSYDVFVGGENPHLPFKTTPPNAVGYTQAWSLRDAADEARGIVVDPTTGLITIPTTKKDGTPQPDDNFGVSLTITNPDGTTESDSSTVSCYMWDIDLNTLSDLKVGATFDAKQQIDWPSSCDFKYNYGGVVTDNISAAQLTWGSTNPAVASVDADGIVTGKSVGSCRIYFTINYAGLHAGSTGSGACSSGLDVIA